MPRFGGAAKLRPDPLELDRLKDVAKATVGPNFAGRENEISPAFRTLNKKLVRQRILREKVRIDGRGLTDIRTLSAEVEVECTQRTSRLGKALNRSSNSLRISSVRAVRPAIAWLWLSSSTTATTSPA